MQHRQAQVSCNSFVPAVEAGPGEAGGASPLCEPSKAVAPPARDPNAVDVCIAIIVCTAAAAVR